MDFNFIENLRKKSKKAVEICNEKKMGVDIDKNEFYEIIESNSAHPEKMK